MSLAKMPVFFLDLQTTGAKPETAFILEMAYGDLISSPISFLVEQPPEHEIPRRIQMITGVTKKDLENATPFPEVMKGLIHFIRSLGHEGNALCVIHFSQFEKPFLKSAFEAIGMEVPFMIIDTHDIAKRLLPNLPTRGIKGLSGYFGYDSGELKRSASHVEATKAIWVKLAEMLDEKEITNLEELQNWLIETPKVSRTKYEYPLPKEIRLKLPDCPGIYRMLNYKGEVLYVGKATSLKSRVNSYFRGQKNRDPRKLEMLTMTVDLRVTTCDTPLESALMETDEIKKLNPRYNISLKKGHRALAFFNRNFDSVNSTDDDEHTIGPFSGSLVFEAMIALNTWLKTSYKDGELPPEKFFFEELDPQMIKDGFTLFCERHNFIPKKFESMRAIVAQAILWQRQFELLEIEEDAEEDADNELPEIKVLLTPEDLADKFERHFTRIGRAYMRARKINRMLNSNVIYHIFEDSSYKLTVRNGAVSKTFESTPVDTLNTWKEHSIETYDRMTVLLTELERVRTAGGDYEVTYTN
ncbi:MAG: GIY-YIG nuclease family protein [Bacteriovorax sp.]|nr:GIY-YIG nuclease family protein [Bacteriovorax sp.]